MIDRRSPNREKNSPVSTTAPPVDQKVQVESRSVSHEAIAEQAYDIYLKNGCQHGTSEKNWFEAEQQLNGNPAPENPGGVKMVDEGGPPLNFNPPKK